MWTPLRHTREDMMFGSEIASPKLVHSTTPRRQLSLYLPAEMTVGIVGATGQPVSPDPGSLALTVNIIAPNQSDPDTVMESLVVDPASIINDGVGLYRYMLPTQYTQQRGLLQAVWTYTYEGSQARFEEFFQVLDHMPLYAALSPAERGIVERVNWRFGDLFDNTASDGPSFFEEFQTHWGYERITQLMVIALNKINAMGQPLTSYRVGIQPGNTGKRLGDKWHFLLEFATYIETLRHFIRTYVEQPTIDGSTVTSVNRRDYMQRWRDVLQDEKGDLDAMVAQFKRAHRGLGRGALVVDGGIYGSSNNYGYSGALSARAARFYPLTSAVVGGGIW